MTVWSDVPKRTRSPQLLQLIVVSLVALLGLAMAFGLDVSGLEHTRAYMYIAFALLCFGLYMAVRGIDLAEVKEHWLMVLIALTVGVLAKYLIIAAITVALTGNWDYAVLAMAVSQIDPLSVSALNNDRRMSDRTRTVLNMWAAFDDPVTALGTPVMVGLVATMGHLHSTPRAGIGDLLLQLGPFIIAAPFAAFMMLKGRFDGRWVERTAWLRDIRSELRQHDGEGIKTWIMQALVTLASLSKGPSISALAGLFVRPQWLAGRFGAFLTRLALAGAAFLLGILLVGGTNWSGGLLLGSATYGSQIIVAWGVVGLDRWLSPAKTANRFSSRDVWHLALAQQNGITAIVLSLVLEINISSAVATIAPMIVVVAFLQAGANYLFDRIEQRIWPEAVVKFTAAE